MLAIEATVRSIDFSFPLPHLRIKRHLLTHFMKKWRYQWYYSHKGRYTYDLGPVVYFDFLLLTLSSKVFLTGHGLFRACLIKNPFKRTSFPTCKWDDVAVASHYFYNCPLTTRWYIHHPPFVPDDWLANISSRPTFLLTFKNIFNFLYNLSVLLHH